MLNLQYDYAKFPDFPRVVFSCRLIQRGHEQPTVASNDSLVRSGESDNQGETMRTLLIILIPYINACASNKATSFSDPTETSLHSFRTICLSDTFYNEGATFGDLNNDGARDIISGPYWYEGPDFKNKHEYYPPKTFDIREFSDNFFAFVHDLNADGWKDILIIGFPGKDASWFENPGNRNKEPGHWSRHLIHDTVDNESPTFTDLTGDGKPELVFQTAGQFGYASPDWSQPEKRWKFRPISPAVAGGRFTHGLGVGDIDGDGRLDFIERSGWWRQPRDKTTPGYWQYHAYPFAPIRGGAQMYAYDVDGDGDADVITSLNAHWHGLAWFEQVRHGDEIGFVKHLILGNHREDSAYRLLISHPHAIDLVDIDGDGLKDILIGRRGSGSESTRDEQAIYWFKLQRTATGIDWIPFQVKGASGVGTQVVAGDVNGDMLDDIVVGNKYGTHIYVHEKKTLSRREYLDAMPRRFSTYAPATELSRPGPDGLLLHEFDGIKEPGLWDPFDIGGKFFRYEATREALENFDAGRGDQNLVRRGLLVDPRRQYVIETKFQMPESKRKSNAFALHFNIAGGDLDASPLSTWSINVDIAENGPRGRMKYMGFSEGKFVSIGSRPINWGAKQKEFLLRAAVNTAREGHQATNRVTVTVLAGDTRLEHFEVDYTPHRYQPDLDQPVRIGVNGFGTDWRLRDLRVYYISGSTQAR